MLLYMRQEGIATHTYLWIILLLIPFLSNFVLSFVFFLALIGGLWLVDWLRVKKADWIFFSAIASMTSIYVIKNYLLITSMFFVSGFTFHREVIVLDHNSFER